mmetsp:Transcript_112796/g.318925  ORF Transcript_112796/g.318925 Transcript_112796/m.318925 type:complete len:252 (+) Transcript_112796:150-905(+)
MNLVGVRDACRVHVLPAMVLYRMEAGHVIVALVDAIIGAYTIAIAIIRTVAVIVAVLGVVISLAGSVHCAHRADAAIASAIHSWGRGTIFGSSIGLRTRSLGAWALTIANASAASVGVACSPIFHSRSWAGRRPLHALSSVRGADARVHLILERNPAIVQRQQLAHLERRRLYKVRIDFLAPHADRADLWLRGEDHPADDFVTVKVAPNKGQGQLREEACRLHPVDTPEHPLATALVRWVLPHRLHRLLEH